MAGADDAPLKGREVWTSERCYITELLNDAADVSLARARVEPGVQTELHALSIDEWYVIEFGSGWMRVADAAPYEVKPGDTVHIAAGQAQQIENRGKADLIFLCVCQPGFTPDTYRSLER